MIQQAVEKAAQAVEGLHPAAAITLGVVSLFLGVLPVLVRNWKNLKADTDHQIKGTKMGIVWTVIFVALAAIFFGGLALIEGAVDIVRGLLSEV